MEPNNNPAKIFFIASILFTVFSLSHNSFMDSDTWWHMSSGREIVRAHGLPQNDTFSYSATSKWYSHEWLFDVIIYAAVAAAGVNNLIWLKMLMALLLLGLVFLIARLRQARYMEAGLPFLALSLYLLAPYLTLRPQFFSFLFVLYFIYVLEHKPTGKNAAFYYSLPFAGLIWVNIHASEVIGPAIMLLYIIYYASTSNASGEKYDFKMPAICFAATLGASFISPEGVNSFVFFAQDFGIKKYIMEWGPGFDFSSINYIIYFILFYIYAAAFTAAALYSMKKSNVVIRAAVIKDVFIGVVLLTGAIAVRKNIPLFIIVSMPLVLHYFSTAYRTDFLLNKKMDLARVNRASSLIYLTAAILVLCIGAARLTSPQAQGYPEQAVKYIAGQKPPQNLFSSYEWSGYIEYSLYPEYKIMIDGRLNVPFDIISEYSGIYNKNGDYKGYIDANKINSFLLPYGAPITGVLAGNYRAAYFDDKGILLVNPESTGNYFKYINPAGQAGFYDKNNYDKAAAEMKKFAEAYPSERACLMLAMMYGDKNRKQAIEYMEQAIEEHPDFYSLYNLLGKIYFDGMEYGKAADILAKSGKRTKEINEMLKTANIRKIHEQK